MAQRYIITVDVDMESADDPAALSGTIVDAIHGAAMSVPGVTQCDIAGVA